MADNNYTKYCLKIDENAVNDMKTGGCMSFVKSTFMDGSVNIVIEKDRISEDLTYEDVLRWIEIGNSLIFPAESKIVKAADETAEGLRGIAKGVDVILRPLSSDYKKYVYNDAKRALEGVIKDWLVTETNRHYYIPITITKEEKGSGYRGYGWNICSDDFLVRETGQVLTDYLTEEIKEALLNVPERPHKEELCLTIKRSNCVSGQHLLAVLSFYRLTWSNLYKGVVKETLKLIDSGIDPWLAFSYVWAKGAKDPYYGFSERSYLFNDMTQVLKNLVGQSINKSFTNQLMSLRNIKQATVAQYLGGKNVAPPVLICSDSRGAKTLTMGKEYLSLYPLFRGEYKVVCDDGVSRRIKHSRFTLK